LVIPMPVTAARPCKHAGCGALVRHDSGYCEVHRGEARRGKFADPYRGSRQSRGYGASWDKLRLTIFARDNGLCQECLRMGIVAAPTGRARICDHIVPKAEGGTDDPTNLQTLCLPCSNRKTADEAARACKTAPPPLSAPAGAGSRREEGAEAGGASGKSSVERAMGGRLRSRALAQGDFQPASAAC